MGLIKFIPILDWFVDGYAMRWGRDLILDEVGGMPKKIFGDRTFVNGAMNFLVALVISIVSGVLNMVLGWIPVFGLLVGIALWLFMDVVKATLVIRMAVFDELGEGFNITAAMKALKGNWPKVLFIVAIPAMIIFAIGFLFAIIWTSLYCLTFGGEAMFTIYSFINQLGGLNSFEKAMANNPQIAVNFAIMLLNVGFSFIIFYLPCFFVINVLGSFLTVLQTRAMGHFVARYCQSWKLEPKFDQVKRL